MNRIEMIMSIKYCTVHFCYYQSWNDWLHLYHV